MQIDEMHTILSIHVPNKITLNVHLLTIIKSLVTGTVNVT